MRKLAFFAGCTVALFLALDLVEGVITNDLSRFVCDFALAYLSFVFARYRD